MSLMTRSRRPRSAGLTLTAPRATAGLAAAAAISLLAACGGSSGPAASSSGSSGGSGASASASPTVLAGGSCKSSNATQITFWAWVPGIARAVNAFNSSHPSICVTLEDVGAGNPEYV